MDLSDLDDTIKRTHVKPEGDQWLVLALTDLESYFDDLDRYGEVVANENLCRMRESRGFAAFRFIDTARDGIIS